MSTTPLTDAINALTTYSNTVTGASDTTLSDAVATLAAGYGGGGINLSAIAQSASLNNIGGLFNAFMNGTWGSAELTVVSGTNPIEVDFGRAIKGYIAYPKNMTILSGLDTNERSAISIATFGDPDGTGAQTAEWTLSRWKTNASANGLFNRIGSWTLINGVLSMVPQYPSNAQYNPFGFGNTYIFVYWW